MTAAVKRTRGLAVLAAAALIFAPRAAGADLKADGHPWSASRVKGRLDLDIYGREQASWHRPREAAGAFRGWVPGDPRHERGESAWVRSLSHVGYAGLGVVGLAGSLASGGVAPAVGFGIVAAVQSFRAWRQAAGSSPGP